MSMVNKLLLLHQKLYTLHWYLSLNKKHLFFRTMMRVFHTALLPFVVFAIKHKHKVTAPLKGSENPQIVVSLTTFPKRISNLWIVIESLFNQTIKPNLIVVNLTKEEFPNGEDDLPESLLYYKRLGLKIEFRDLNLRPHLKYYYTLQEYSNCDVITVDDDLIYYPDSVENLYKIKENNPGTIVSNNIRHIAKGVEGYKPYKNWDYAKNDITDNSKEYLALGYSGVLYPQGLVDIHSQMFDAQKIKDLCLGADDLWLHVHEVIQGLKISSGKFRIPAVEIPGSQIISLKSSNCDNSRNDILWQNLVKHYNIDQLCI